MKKSLTFNGTRRGYAAVMERGKPYWATRKRELLTIPGRPGAYHTKTEYDPLVIPVTFMIEVDDAEIMDDTLTDFAEWLDTEGPAELVFDDSPDLTYYAMAEGAIEPELLFMVAFVQVNFICPDPHRYGPEQRLTFSQDVEEVENRGKSPTPPAFRAEVHGNITNLDIVTPEAYMRVGAPAPVDAAPTEPRTLVLANELTIMSGWTEGTAADNGHVAGAMTTDGQGFIASLWGQVRQPLGYQGPAVKRSFASPLQDFEAEIALDLLNGVVESGTAEVYFLDAANNVVCKIGMEDTYRNAKINTAKLELGPLHDRHTIERQADYSWNWNDFKGVVRIKRQGTRYEAYFAKVNPTTGVHHTRAFLTYVDVEEKYQTPISQIQLSLRKWPDYPQAGMRFNRVDVWRLNQPIEAEPFYIAGAGDVIEIDHKKGEILVNGEPRMWLKDFGSTFFQLRPGKNILTYSPAHLVTLSANWRERRL